MLFIHLFIFEGLRCHMPFIGCFCPHSWTSQGVKQKQNRSLCACKISFRCHANNQNSCFSAKGEELGLVCCLECHSC